MAKGVRRTAAQLIAEYEAKIEELKARASVTADHVTIKALVADMEKAADKLGVSTKEVLKLVTSKVSPRVKKVVDADVEPPESVAKKPRAKKA